jgi:hypothetical protein
MEPRLLPYQFVVAIGLKGADVEEAVVQSLPYKNGGAPRHAERYHPRSG